jgi:hypothetical protein
MSEEPDPARVAQQPNEVVVSGLFIRTFGDPPSGSGEAQIVYTVTTSAGREWTLVFDKEHYWPPKGVRQFHRKQVVVKGSVLRDGRLLVESLELR